MALSNHKSRVDVQGGLSLTLPYIYILSSQVYEAFIHAFLEESVASTTDRVW
jgi:hypothetical protein